jgi:hypothetical protein
MKRLNLKYPILVVVIIILGILSRETSFVPLSIGDLLYAMIIYFLIRIFAKKLYYLKSSIFALLFCFSIECSQLYQSNWINEIRKSTLGHYVLGQGFLWGDLAAYFTGILIAHSIDKYLFNSKSNEI